MDIYHKYLQLLKENKAPIDQLVFIKRLSKDSNKYQKRNTIENNAPTKLNSQLMLLYGGPDILFSN